MTNELRETFDLNYGDIITVDGYDGQYFRINGYQVNTLYTENEPDMTEHWLDLHCAHTGGYTMAFADEVTLVCRKDEATEYLADKPTPIIATGGIALASIFDFSSETEAPLKPITPPSKRTLNARKQERIDGYLDDLINVNNAIELIGDGGELQYYGAKKAGILAGLEAMTK